MSIKKIISDKRILAIMSAVTYIAHVFKSFMIPLQSKAPMITVLFPKMQKLLQELFSFLNENVFLEAKKLWLMVKIVAIDLSDSRNHAATCKLGSRYSNEVEGLNALEKKQVDELMRKVLTAVFISYQQSSSE